MYWSCWKEFYKHLLLLSAYFFWPSLFVKVCHYSADDSVRSSRAYIPYSYNICLWCSRAAFCLCMLYATGWFVFRHSRLGDWVRIITMNDMEGFAPVPSYCLYTPPQWSSNQYSDTRPGRLAVGTSRWKSPGLLFEGVAWRQAAVYPRRVSTGCDPGARTIILLWHAITPLSTHQPIYYLGTNFRPPSIMHSQECAIAH